MRILIVTANVDYDQIIKGLLERLLCVLLLFSAERALAEPIRLAPPQYVDEPQFEEIATPTPSQLNAVLAKRKKAPPIQLGVYRRELDLFARGVVSDGHADDLAARLGEINKPDLECRACKPLIGALASALRGAIRSAKVAREKSIKLELAARAKAAAEAEEELDQQDQPGDSLQPIPTPPESRRRTVPHTEVLDSVSRMFIGMAEDEKLGEELFDAVDRVVQHLRGAGSLDAAASSYYSTLTEYMLAPFAEQQRRRQRDAQAAGSRDRDYRGRDELGSVDDMFDF